MIELEIQQLKQKTWSIEEIEKTFTDILNAVSLNGQGYLTARCMLEYVCNEARQRPIFNALEEAALKMEEERNSNIHLQEVPHATD